MKKLLTVLAIFALIFTACEQPTDEGNSGSKLPSLTIRNESSYVLTNVKFSNIAFAASGNDLSISSQSVKQLTANDVNKTGYITFTRKDIGIDCRTEAVSIGDKDYTFIFLDTSVVEEIANSSNKKSLSQITFVSAVTVERGTLPVARNQNLNLGETVINRSKQFDFTLKNTGVGKLLLSAGGTEPVRISGDTANVFSIVQQPSSPEIAPNGSLPFKISFNPKAAQEYTAAVTIISNDQNGDFTFSIIATGTPPKPVAEVYYNDKAVSQNGTIDAGEVIITYSKNITVEIKNTGTQVLTLDTANINIVGANAAAFSKLTNPGGSISENGQSSFIIKCEPTEPGTNSATLTIPTDDSSRNPVIIILQMTAVKGSAVLELMQADTVIANNSLTPFDFGRVSLDSNKPLVFTIKNTGNIALELTGNPAVESSNAVFTIPTQPVNKIISPQADISFLLLYTPTVEAEETASITLYNNSDDMVFTLNVKGTGYIKRPQITVKQGNLTVNQYGDFNFDTVALGENKDVTFDIENTGEANLNIISVNGSRINLEDNTDGLFSVVQQPSTVVTPGNSTNFIVRFSPTVEENNFAATVHIKTDSQDNDEFYFLVKGAGYIKRPQITVKQETAAISPNGEYDFDSILVGTTKDVIFTIENSGEANLNFVSVNGNNANIVNNTGSFFTIIQQPLASSVAPGDTTAFMIRFSPTTVGNNYSATVKITTDSQNNNEFSFRVKGNGRSYVIGDTGPGGGLIFFASGERYKECSAELGLYAWTQAVAVTVAHRGGGFTTWHLPDRGELSLMYQNLYLKGLGGFSTDNYWSSVESGAYGAWYTSFRYGTQDDGSKTNSYRVRAVRSFGL